MQNNPALSALRHHVSGAIERGEAVAIAEVRDVAAVPFVTPWAATAKRRIESGRITESQLRKMRSILADAINRGDSASCTVDEAEALLSIVETMPIRVEDAQARKGADWLHRLAFTKAGEQRRTEFARQFIAQDLEVIRACHASASPRFTLQGFEDSREWERWCTLSPIYRCHAGEECGAAWFDYVARSWQSGGRSFIIARG